MANLIGNTIVNNFDRFTGEPFNATKVTTWWDGTPMDDTKVDNAIYFKVPAELGGGYAKRNFNGTVDIKWFGAVGQGADDTTILQTAENTCSNLSSINRRVKLFFGEGVYNTSASLNKASNVDWVGEGEIRRIDANDPSGNAFSIVVARNASNFTITGLTIRNIKRDIEVENSISTSMVLGRGNTCFDVYGCSDFTITKCHLYDFARGIHYRGCSVFSIEGNNLKANTNTTIEDLLNGTDVPLAGGTGTGGLVIGWDAELGVRPADPSIDYRIINNYIEIPGLDVAMEVLNQTFDKQPAIISKNMIRGGNSAIQVYRGSLADTTGDKPTYRTSIVIEGNHIYATRQQGIYIRGTYGTQIINNYIERAALQQGGTTGTPWGSIVTRVNPSRGDLSEFTSFNNGTVSDEHATFITGNQIIDQGRPGVNSDACIHVRINNTVVVNNTISRSKEIFGAEDIAVCRGILIDNSELLVNFKVSDNVIKGSFSNGIQYISANSNSTAGSSLPNSVKLIGRNVINGTKGAGLIVDASTLGLTIEDNNFTNCVTGINLINAPSTIIRNNIFKYCTTGLIVGSGTFASFMPTFLNNSISTQKRRGATLIALNNIFIGNTTHYSIVATSAGDTRFMGRFKKFEAIVDGVVIRNNTFNDGVVPTNGSESFEIGDKVYLSNLGTGNISAEKMCSSPGQYYGNNVSSPVFNNGDTVSGSNIVSNVTNIGTLGTGVYIVLTGVTGHKKIVNVIVNDNNNYQLILDSNCDATLTQTLISNKDPEFVDAHPILGSSLDSAAPISAEFNQTEIQAILDELRDLKAKMRAVGLLDS